MIKAYVVRITAVDESMRCQAGTMFKIPAEIVDRIHGMSAADAKAVSDRIMSGLLDVRDRSKTNKGE